MGELENRSRRKAEVKNLWNLMKLQLFTQRYYYLVAAGITLFLTLANVYQICFKKVVFIEDTISTMGNNIFPFLILILIFAGNNFLGNERISMYPGTIKTRVAARFCVDYLLIIIMSVWEFVLYLLGGGLLLLVTKEMPNVNTSFVFLWSSLWEGMLARIVVGAAVYALCILVYGVLNRLGNKWSIVLFLLGMVVLYITLPFVGGIVEAAILFFTTDQISFGMYLLRFMLLWCVSFLLTWVLVLTARQWKRSNGYLMWLFLMVMIISMPVMKFRIRSGEMIHIYTENSSDNVHSIEDLYNYREPGLYKDSVIKKSEDLSEDITFINSFLYSGIVLEDDDIVDLHFSTSEVLTETQAKEYGYVEENFSLPEDKMVLRVAANSAKLDGNYLYEGLVQNIEFIRKEGGICSNSVGYRPNDYKLVLPYDTWNHIKRYQLAGVHDSFELSGINQLVAILIVDDELKKAYDTWEIENEE